MSAGQRAVQTSTIQGFGRCALHPGARVERATGLWLRRAQRMNISKRLVFWCKCSAMYSRFPVQYAELLCLLLPMHTVDQ